MKRSKIVTVCSITLVAALIMFSYAPDTAQCAEKKMKLVSSTWLVSPPGFSAMDQKWFIDEVIKKRTGNISNSCH